MGPPEGRRPVPLSEAGGSVDWVAELSRLCERHKLDRAAVPGKVAVSWMTDDGPHVEARDDARDLALYLRARFGAR